jgi:3-phenylpropionate/trans-cinnamate dioxygenase ferredoxin reductase component
MTQKKEYTYVIVGAGLAGVSAAQGIRDQGSEASMLIIGDESHPPYHRPPLSKGLWTGTRTVADVYVEDDDYYKENEIAMQLETRVTAVNPSAHEVTTHKGEVIGYRKLLLATGGRPKTLPIAGAGQADIIYYRYLADFERASAKVNKNTRTLIIGGSFIGSEMAASLSRKSGETIMLFPEEHICGRIFPQSLAHAIERKYREKGVTIKSGDTPVEIQSSENGYAVRTKRGETINAELIIAGLGIAPAVDLAARASLQVDNGIVCDEYLQTSEPDIYAAGDNAKCPYHGLGQRRIEHWDNAKSQGFHAGKNMAGADEPFRYLPYFFSDLYDFGYEAVGATDASLDIFTDWKKENEGGVIYYLKDNKVRGVMLCNVWEKTDNARAIIQSGETVRPESLKGLIS